MSGQSIPFSQRSSAHSEVMPGVGAQIQRHLAARSAEVSRGLLEGEDAAIAGAPGAHLHFVGGVPLLLLTLSHCWKYS